MFESNLLLFYHIDVLLVNINANPGFTDEALKSLTLKVKNSPHPVYCALMMNEMAIRQHLQYDNASSTYHGRVDLGNGMTNDSLDIAKECFVFMVVFVNENWKLPIGYFLVNNLNSSQKAKLVKHALTLLELTGVKIISLIYCLVYPLKTLTFYITLVQTL